MTSSKGGLGGGLSQMMIFDDIGGGVGVPKVPKMDDVIYEQSLSINTSLIYMKLSMGQSSIKVQFI